MKQKRSKIPSRQEYVDMVKVLTEKKDLDTLIVLRMGAELGMTRIEIVNARTSDIDRLNKRGLWIDVAKKVRRGTRKTKKGRRKPVMVMRQREIPINTSLYQLLVSYVDKEHQTYILKRKKGDMTKHFTPRYINTIYERAGISWSSHRSRHYFKNRIWDWMREHRQPDEGLVSEFMGHKKSQTQEYGSISWDYKIGVIDEVFK
jgi:integrase